MAISVQWLGHGSFSLDINGTPIVIDPFISDNPSAPVKLEDLKAKYILISHGHFDHIADAVPLATRTGAQIISNFEIANWFAEKHGIKNSHSHHIGGGVNYEFGYVKLTIAHHGSKLPDGSDGGNPAGFLITADGKKLYFACDTGLFESMKLYGEEGLDLACLPIGDKFTMGPDDALRAVKMLTPKVVIPVHYNTWDPIAQDADAWAKRVEAETDTQCKVLQPGHMYTL